MEKILIVVDIQKDFVDGSLGTKEAVAIIGNACERIKSHNGKIYVTFDTHGSDYMDSSEGKNLPVSHCIKGTDGHALDENIKNALDGKDWVAVEKPTFGSVDLPVIIKNNHGTDVEIELIGLCTDICVVSNALILKANFPESKIAVVENCCAGVTPEKHNAAIETMKSCQIVIE
jgi:nicotinamidase-related amidase